jgi:hypothetical protein
MLLLIVQWSFRRLMFGAAWCGPPRTFLPHACACGCTFLAWAARECCKRTLQGTKEAAAGNSSKVDGRAPTRTVPLLRACPPRSLHQTAAWKAGHKHECAREQGAAAAALIRRAAREAARPAPRAQAVLTKEQRRPATRLVELQAADDWLSMMAQETDALALARDLRAHPGVEGAIHSAFGLGFEVVGEYARALELLAQAKAISEALGDRAGWRGVRQNRQMQHQHGGVRAGARAACGVQGDIGGAGGPRGGGGGVRQPRDLLPAHGGIRAGACAA